MSDVVAVVLARGLGRRMRAHADARAVDLTTAQQAVADAGVKALIPIGAGEAPARPFLDFLLSALADAGYRTVVLVVGPEHDALRHYYQGAGAPRRLAIAFAVQPAALGTADAVVHAEAAVDGRPFVVLNADNLYPVDMLRALRALDGPGVPVFERDQLVESSHIPAGRVAAFALLTVAPDGALVDIVEKPGEEAMAAAGPRALVSMNAWRFDERIFAACRDVPRSVRGEFELPESVRLAIRRGVIFRAVPARGPVLDLSRREDVPVVTAHLAGVLPDP